MQKYFNMWLDSVIKNRITMNQNENLTAIVKTETVKMYSIKKI